MHKNFVYRHFAIKRGRSFRKKNNESINEEERGAVIQEKNVTNKRKELREYVRIYKG